MTKLFLMIKTSVSVFLICALASCGGGSTAGGGNNKPTIQPVTGSADILALMEKVADWQIARVDTLDYIPEEKLGRSLEEAGWVQSSFYSGLTALAERSDSSRFETQIESVAMGWGWALGPRTFHADDHLAGQIYLWMYERNQDARYIEDTQITFDYILANAPDNEAVGLNWNGGRCQSRWCWADALYMAPATWLGMSKVTGDPKYADYGLQELNATIDHLYSEEHDLMYRDTRFFTRVGDFNEPIFWSRGMGWVFAGLARSLELIPEDDARRQRIEQVFIEIAAKLKTLQKQDGTWAMSLLATENYPQPETSGTGFLTFGLAWGIRNGLLDKDEYWPTITQAWDALTAAVQEDGKLGWVQPIGAQPGQVTIDDSQLFGVGAFLLTGSMLYDFALDDEAEQLIQP